MPHIITASLGRDHITSANARRYHAGTLGNGAYVLPMRGRLACSMVNSNTLRVMSGDAVLCGCHWAIDGDYEDYNVENGVPGYNRIDLLVARVSLSPRESVELIVRKGEEVTGEPVAPNWVDGDLNDGDTVAEMPICTVRVSGINASAPVMLVWESPTFIGHKHSASDVTSGTLPAARGGTGQTSLQATRSAMGLGNTLGALPVANGGTGQTTLALARNAMGLGNTTGALPVANGGSGMNASPSILVNLGSSSAASVFQASPRPGITGTLPVSHGGTGATTAASARTNLGILPGYIVAGHNASQALRNSMSRVTLGTVVDVVGSGMFQLSGNVVKVLKAGLYFVYGQAAVNNCGSDNSVQLNVIGSKVVCTSLHVWGFDTLTCGSVMKLTANQAVYMDIGNWSGNVGDSPANAQLSYLVVAKIGEV